MPKRNRNEGKGATESPIFLLGATMNIKGVSSGNEIDGQDIRMPIHEIRIGKAA